MSSAIHDYRGKNLYQLVRDGVRYEFKVQELWVEVFSDVHPTAIGVKLMCNNPQLKSKVVKFPLEFVLYFTPNETDRGRSILKAIFATLDSALWDDPQPLASEAIHLSNGLMTTPHTRYRVPLMVGTRAVVTDIRARLICDVEQLPTLTGPVRFTANALNEKITKFFTLEDVKKKTGVPFSLSSLSTFTTAFEAKEIK